MTVRAFTVRPSEKTSETINILSEKMGVTKNKLISSFLEEAQPHMEQMIAALDLLNDKNPEGYSELSKSLKDVIYRASQKQSDIVEMMVKEGRK